MAQKKIKVAAELAAQVAADAAVEARNVAQRAVDEAKKVSERASETAEKVLLFAEHIKYIQTDISEIKEKLDNKYLTKESFKESFGPVQKITYGFVGLILVGVVGAIISLVIIK